MAIISIGTVNKSLLFIFLMGIFTMFNQYLLGYVYIDCFAEINFYARLYKWIIDDKKKDFPPHRIFDPLFSYIGVIFFSFLVRAEKDEEKEENEEKENNSRAEDSTLNLDLIHTEKYDFTDSQTCVWIVLKILILWIIEENLLIIYIDVFQDLDFWFFELIFVSYVFSKNFAFKIYSHQILGMALSITVGSALKIYNITITFSSSNDDQFFYKKYPFLCFFAIFYFLLILLRSYVNTELKALMDLKFVSQRTLLMGYGIVGFIICLLVGIFTSLVRCPDTFTNYVCKIKYDDEMYFDKFLSYYESGMNLLVRLIIIVLASATHFFNKYYCTSIIKSYTPIHVIFSFPLEYFIEKNLALIYSVIFSREDLFKKDKQLEKYLLDTFGDVGAIFGFVIYLEIIELNFWGFNYNLAKNIMNRGENDYQISMSFHQKIKEDNRLSTNLFGDDNSFIEE